MCIFVYISPFSFVRLKNIFVAFQTLLMARNFETVISITKNKLFHRKLDFLVIQHRQKVTKRKFCLKFVKLNVA